MKARKIFAGTMAALMMTLGASALAADTGYSDVRDTDWFAPAVKTATAHKLMQGVGDNKFAPRSGMTRAMVVQVLYNEAGQPEIHSSNAFADVTADQWYYDAIQWASENGIASGVGDGKFEPNKSVTRQEFAAFLYRSDGSDASDTQLDFIDAGDVSEWARKAIAWAVEKGIIKGSLQSDDILKLFPKHDATRAEAAQMLSGYMDVTEKHSYEEKVILAPTETTVGIKGLTCSVCGKETIEKIDALGHGDNG